MRNKKGGVLLIIDDDTVFSEAIRDYFMAEGMEVLTAGSGVEGLEICSSRKVDVVLLDQQLPDGEGNTFCQPILEQNDQAKIIFITAYPSFEGAVKAIKAGAHDYLSKPFELEELRMEIEQAFRTVALEKVEQLHNYMRVRESEEMALIGGAGKFAETVGMVGLAAESEAPVLITGETGTGKNVIAKAIHYRSRLKKNAFIGINCAALPENLIEAELFGYEKGAFTGAVVSRKGIMEMAEGGTLFLDEIGEMPVHLQSKLLNVLEDKIIRRLGGKSARSVDLRIIAATGINLEQALDKSFRKDLYYRLSVIRIHVPPLRERTEDLPELCRFFLKRIPRGTEVAISGAEMSRLMDYGWPGNVRELKNVLERAVILQKGSELRPSELLGFRRLPDRSQSGPVPDQDIMTISELEKNHIKAALEKLSGNYTRTSRALGISLSTLKRKIRQYGLK